MPPLRGGLRSRRRGQPGRGVRQGGHRGGDRTVRGCRHHLDPDADGVPPGHPRVRAARRPAATGPGRPAQPGSRPGHGQGAGERQRRGRWPRHRFVTPPLLNRCPGMLTWDTPKESEDALPDSQIAPERDLSRPARDSAQETPRTSWAAAAALHAGVALCVAGAAAVLALTVFVVPAPVFLAVFTVITTVLVV